MLNWLGIRKTGRSAGPKPYPLYFLPTRFWFSRLPSLPFSCLNLLCPSPSRSYQEHKSIRPKLTSSSLGYHPHPKPRVKSRIWSFTRLRFFASGFTQQRGYYSTSPLEEVTLEIQKFENCILAGLLVWIKFDQAKIF